MTRAQAHARALRAASRVTFTLGIFGCAEDAQEPVPEPVEEVADAVAEDAAPPIDERADDQRDMFVDAAVDPALDAGAPVPEDAGPTLADAAPTDAGVACEFGSPDYAACCEAVNWDFDAGCMAWGPPVPPALLA